MASKQTIYASAGGCEFTKPITISGNHALTGDPVYLCFGASNGTTPVNPTWYTPDSIVFDDSTDSVTVKLLVGSGGTASPPAGTYLIWFKIGDNPETPVRPTSLLLTVA